MTPTNQEEQKARYEQLRAQSKKMKRRILLVLICFAAVILLLLAAIKLIQFFTENEDLPPQYQYEFSPVYDGDIMQSKEYLGLNRMIEYCDDPAGYGVKQSVIPETFEDFDQSVIFLYHYVQTIIAGDAVAYNACFNETYFKDVAPLSDFPQQMLHEIKLTYQSEQDGGNGEKLLTYRLEYMIHKNNGLFRRDVGSDASRPQYVTLRIYADGSILIEKLVTEYTDTKQ